jgi:molybdopterin synthase sulfur carrier subunit
MARLEFLGPIDRAPMEVDISNLRELKSLLNEDTQLQEWLGNSAVAVNDTLVSSLDTPIKADDIISLLPPVCGG